MYPNYITLSRTKLYELVWSRPVADVAKDFGISDVALAKRCRAINVPLPPRGYWARVAAGQTPPRTVLPSLRPERPPRVNTNPTEGQLRKGRVPRYIENRTAPETKEPHIRFRVPEVKEAGFQPPALPIDIPAPDPDFNLTTALAAIKRTARYKKHPARANLTLARGERSRPVLDLSVSVATLDRALQFCGYFLQSIQSLGWTLIEPEAAEAAGSTSRRTQSDNDLPAAKSAPLVADLEVNGERICFRIEELMIEKRREATPHETARMKREYGYRPTLSTFHPTGRLRFVRLSGREPFARRQSWTERVGHRLEEKTTVIMAALSEYSHLLKADREESERRQKAWAEQERLRQELKDRREHNQQRIHQLELQAGAWHRARFLRSYLRAVKREFVRQQPPLSPSAIHFIEWAQGYVDQLDPLTHVDRHPDFSSEGRVIPPEIS